MKNNLAGLMLLAIVGAMVLRFLHSLHQVKIIAII
jgi:hypothetical protein